ncbi:MAG TPA: hypothetical protein DCY94_01800 [Firmicutes bacterium]|nr:hypothetical protein [Bacillota bacterium]
MLEFFQVYLPITVYVLLIILLIIGIILGVRLINAMDKVDEVLNNVQKKVNSLNGLFSVIDFTTDKISAFSDRVVDTISGFISRIGRKKMKNERNQEKDE